MRLYQILPGTLLMCSSLSLLAEITPVQRDTLEDVSVSLGATVEIQLDDFLGFYDSDAPLLLVETTEGDFTIRLRPDLAANTVSNFLDYVEGGDYEGTLVHRSVPGFVIQTGGYQLLQTATGGSVEAIQVHGTIENEFNHTNARGTLAMAKLAGDPDSATSQWFINLDDNVDLDTQNGGFTVFGEVTGDGMTVADAIASLPRYNLGGAFDSVPLVDYAGSGQVDEASLVLITNITYLPNDAANYDANELPNLVISSNSSPFDVTTDITERTLILYASNTSSGESTITVQASLNGTTIEQTFVVTVTGTGVEDAFDILFPTGEDWWYSEWYGLFNANGWPWIISTQFGWQYMAPIDTDSFWLWDASPSLGWMWVSKDTFPVFYYADGGEFILAATDPDLAGWYYFPSTDEWRVIE